MYNSNLENHLAFLDSLDAPHSDLEYERAIANGTIRPNFDPRSPTALQWVQYAPGTRPVAVPAVHRFPSEYRQEQCVADDFEKATRDDQMWFQTSTNPPSSEYHLPLNNGRSQGPIDHFLRERRMEDEKFAAVRRKNPLKRPPPMPRGMTSLPRWPPCSFAEVQPILDKSPPVLLGTDRWHQIDEQQRSDQEMPFLNPIEVDESGPSFYTTNGNQQGSGRIRWTIPHPQNPEWIQMEVADESCFQRRRPEGQKRQMMYPIGSVGPMNINTQGEQIPVPQQSTGTETWGGNLGLNMWDRGAKSQVSYEFRPRMPEPCSVNPYQIRKTPVVPCNQTTPGQPLKLQSQMNQRRGLPPLFEDGNLGTAGPSPRRRVVLPPDFVDPMRTSSMMSGVMDRRGIWRGHEFDS